MSMLHDDDDYMEVRRMKTGMALGLFAAVSAVVLVLLLTVTMNKKAEQAVKPVEDLKKPKAEEKITENAGLSSLGEDKRTSDELSFWNMYDTDESNNSYVPEVSSDLEDDRVKEKFIPDENSASDNGISGNEVSENQVDSQQRERETVSGNVFDVNELSEGTAQFVDILDSIPKHNRFDEGFEDNGIWKDYALNGQKTSYRGIDVSSYQKNIDWELVAASGIDFCMIRVGSRGYGTGKVVLDEKSALNMDGCINNGIKIGLYFESQATNVLEAIEEANYCVASIGDRRVEYPIVFSSEPIMNDSYRAEGLTKTELSEIAKAFCETVRAYGYFPMIAASKKQFALRFDLSSIANYDLWLYDTDDISVFPYRYSMWQYSVMGDVEGIDGTVDLDMCFTDYSVK